MTPHRSHRCRVLGILLVLAGFGVQAAAQEVVRWQDFEPCGDAGTELVLHEVMRIGDATGAGIVESDLPRLTWSEEIGYFVLDGRGAWFKVFDQDGRFVRVVGRQGEGPGEFGAVALVRVVQGQIVALDVVRRLWHFFDLDGKYVDQRNLGFSAHWFEPVGGSFVVVAALDIRPEFVGYPLHLVNLDEGVPSHHFGAEEPANWKSTDPWARFVVVGRGGRNGSVWGGKAGVPTALEWSAEGRLIRRIEGELPWFPRLAVHPAQERLEPSGPLVVQMMADTDDRLWMKTQLADARWRATMREYMTEGGEPFVPSEEKHKVDDMRLDGFDLRRRCHLGHRMYDDRRASPSLFTRRGEVMAYTTELSDLAVLQIVVHRIGW